MHWRGEVTSVASTLLVPRVARGSAQAAPVNRACGLPPVRDSKARAYGVCTVCASGAAPPHGLPEGAPPVDGRSVTY